MANPWIEAFLKSPEFTKSLDAKLALYKADTVTTGTNIVWYDLSRMVQMLYPYRQLTPLIAHLPRVPGDGGTSHHWKRIVNVNPNNLPAGVPEGSRGPRIAITEQDMLAIYKTMGYESSVTWQARLAGKNLTPDPMGIAVLAQLQSLRIFEEQNLIFGNATVPLGVTPTPTLVAGTAPAGVTATIPTASPGLYVRAVALGGFGRQGYTPYNSATNTGGVPGQITYTPALGPPITVGGGSAQPSAEASVNVTLGQVVTATVTPVPGAVGYAWYASAAAGTETLAGITSGNRVIFSKVPPATAQPIGNLFVSGNPVDNSTNTLIPDGVIPQIYNAILGPAPGTAMATQTILPGVAATGDTLTIAPSGSLLYTKAAGNTGPTVSGISILEFDALNQAAYEQYKISYDRWLISSADVASVTAQLLNQPSTNMPFRMDIIRRPDGTIVAGQRVTTYHNKWSGMEQAIDVHPYMPAGTAMGWSDKPPNYQQNVGNVLEARLRMDYYQAQWPPTSLRYEFGVYVDEVFQLSFCPSFAILNNFNPVSGTPIF
jgi:hypothetical protein